MAVDTTNSSTVKTETTVNASVKAEPSAVALGINVNPWYFQSIPGILKVAQVVVGIICMACGSPSYYDFATFFLFVVVVAFIVTMLLSLVYLFSVKELLPNIPWLQVEGIYTAGATLLYFIAMLVMFIKTTEEINAYGLKFVGVYNSYIAAAVFSIFNTALYAAGSYFLFQDYQATLLSARTTAPTA